MIALEGLKYLETDLPQLQQSTDHLNSILLVDDDNMTNFVNERTIARMNIVDKIHVVKNGKEALDFIYKTGMYSGRTESSPPPNIIFLDINMPVMDGYEFLKIFRKLSGDEDHQVLIVLLSAAVTDEDLSEFGEMSSFRSIKIDYATKPLTTERIESLIERHFGQGIHDENKN